MGRYSWPSGHPRLPAATPEGNGLVSGRSSDPTVASTITWVRNFGFADAYPCVYLKSESTLKHHPNPYALKLTLNHMWTHSQPSQVAVVASLVIPLHPTMGYSPAPILSSRTPKPIWTSPSAVAFAAAGEARRGLSCAPSIPPTRAVAPAMRGATDPLWRTLLGAVKTNQAAKASYFFSVHCVGLDLW